MQTSNRNIRLSNNVRIPFIENGSPSGIPVILLHGFLGSWREYEPAVAHLPESIHALALTQRGHGEASHPKSGYRLQHFSADLAEFMQVKGIPSAIIVGHSMGSAVAQRFAIDYPDLTEALILTSAALPQEGDPAIQEFFDTTIEQV